MMPSLSDLRMVGQTCSAYEAEAEQVERSCETCRHWGGEERDCILTFSGSSSPIGSNVGGPWLASVNQGLFCYGKRSIKGV